MSGQSVSAAGDPFTVIGIPLEDYKLMRAQLAGLQAVIAVHKPIFAIDPAQLGEGKIMAVQHCEECARVAPVGVFPPFPCPTIQAAAQAADRDMSEWHPANWDDPATPPAFELPENWTVRRVSGAGA